MLIGVIFLLGFFYLATKEKIKASIIFVIVTLSWFIPVVHAVGFKDYFILSSISPKSALFSHTIAEHAEMMIKGFLLSFGIAGGFLFYYLTKRKQIKNLFIKHKRIIIFYSAWIVPGFLFNLLMRSDTPGYQMSYLTALLLLISYAIWQSTRKNKLLYIIVLTCIAIFNLYWFFYDRDPTFTKPHRMVSFHYSKLRKNDIKFGNKVTYIQKHFNPKTTIVITSTDYWRMYMYYLKNYYIFSPSGLTIKEKLFQFKEYHAFDWNMKETQNKLLSIVIPDHITTIVFTDDDAHNWVEKYHFNGFT